MAYSLTFLGDEKDYRELFINTYCNPAAPITTFDGIVVKFFPEYFDHAFYESSNKVNNDKAQFSYHRARRIMWIKEALEDPTGDLRVGWNKKNEDYDAQRRVVIVQEDYVVIIWINPSGKGAKLITAYHAETSIEKIKESPKW
jgi:hypothetical protein